MTASLKSRRSWIEVKFHKARILCARHVMATVQAQCATSVQGATIKKEGDLLQSCAQVETLVIPQVVIPKSCASARQKRGKRSPLTVRFTEAQIAIVREKASKTNWTMGAYIRMAALGDSYTPPPDKELRLALLALMRELMAQGNNLNQIAHKLNAGKMTSAEGEDVLEVIKTPLLRTLSKVRNTLACGTPKMC